jgi:hypothetical protein
MNLSRYFGIMILTVSLLATARGGEDNATEAQLEQIILPTPGQIVPLLPGQAVQSLPGQIVQSLPGQLVSSLPGQQAQSLPGQVVQSLSGQMVQSLPGQLVHLTAPAARSKDRSAPSVHSR